MSASTDLNKLIKSIKLNNPLMGTETPLAPNERSRALLQVKLNNPPLGDGNAFGTLNA